MRLPDFLQDLRDILRRLLCEGGKSKPRRTGFPGGCARFQALAFMFKDKLRKFSKLRSVKMDTNFYRLFAMPAVIIIVTENERLSLDQGLYSIFAWL
jgi:hypothetical protein